MSVSTVKCLFDALLPPEAECMPVLLLRRRCPVVGDACSSPLMCGSGSREDRSAQGRGEAHQELLVCAAMPDCSPRVFTVVNYGEI